MRSVNTLKKAAATAVVVLLAISVPISGQPVKISKTEVQRPGAKTQALKPQTTCPVLGAPIDRSLYVDYKGKRIYVSCPGCVEKVKKNPEKYIKKLQSMGEAPETIAEASAKDTKENQKEPASRSGK